MRPIGYLFKCVASRPEWLDTPQITDVYSLGGHVSQDFADHVNYWRHNGFWLFDSPAVLRTVAKEHGISLEGLKLFYYEAHELQCEDSRRGWVPDQPEASFDTDIQEPVTIILEGFDVTSFSAGTSLECSPLSCNACTAEISTNSHCLFPTFEAAQRAVEGGKFENTEPGPYRIIGVYSVHDV